MKATVAAFAFAVSGVSAGALLPRGAGCCFGLTASGSGFKNAVVGQLGDGQNRIGQTSGLATQSATYCLNNGGLTDQSNRGCILTPPTTQFQCDVGATPSTGFSIGPGGAVSANGSTTFYACPTGDNGGYNIYTVPVSGQSKCVPITLNTANGACAPATTTTTTTTKAPTTTASTTTTTTTTTKPPTTTAPATTAPVSSCPAPPAPVTKTVTTTVTVQAGCPQTTSQAPPSSSAPPTTSSAKPTTTPAPTTTASPTTTGKTCPTSLTGAYQTPHLIIPVSSASPNTAYGTSYFGVANSTVSSIFNFDIPQSYAGQTCTYIFLFPQQSQLQTSSFQTSGSGNLVFTQLTSAANQGTTYANQPGKGAQLASISAAPGNSYAISSGSCAAGQTVSVEISATGSYALSFFEDWNPSPIGLFLTSC